MQDEREDRSMLTGSFNKIEQSLCIPEYSSSYLMPARIMQLVLQLQTVLQRGHLFNVDLS